METHRKLLNYAVNVLHDAIGLIYRLLDLATTYVIGYNDASFAGNDDLSSQLGMIVRLKDAHYNACIIHYGSWKCRRITRSILAAEVRAFASCLDYSLNLAHDLNHLLSKHVPVVMCTDSKCLFDTIKMRTTVSEKRLLIDISAIRQEYRKGDLSNVAHVSSDNNLAEFFAKKKHSELLKRLMMTGILVHPINQWIIQN